MSETRPERQYTVRMRCECGGTGSDTIVVPAGTKEKQDAAAWEEAERITEDWVRDGDWGIDGARVGAWYSIEDEESDEDDFGGEELIEVDVPPDHKSLVDAAVHWSQKAHICGIDPEDHDWTAEGEGGCPDNPGVWSTGGTSMTYSSHCRRCGLHRTEYHTGPQHDPGECDTVSYEMPDEEEIARMVEAGVMDESA